MNWTPEICSRLRDLYSDQSTTVAKIAALLSEEFGEKITEGMATGKAQRMKISRPPQIKKERHPRAPIMWTPERDARVVDLYERYSASQVASILSQEFGEVVTRNAIIGKANRLGLSKPPCIRVKRVAAPKPQPVTPVAVAPAPKPIPVPSGVPVKMLDRRMDDQCPFPMWANESGFPDFPVCGQPKAYDAYYCAGHQRAACPKRGRITSEDRQKSKAAAAAAGSKFMYGLCG